MSTKQTDADSGLNSSSSNNNNNIDVEQDWKQTKELDYAYAARLVKDAKELRNITFKKSFNCLKSYELLLSKKFTYVFLAAILIQILLPFIEEPSPYKIAYWIPNSIELVCLVIFLLRWFHLALVQTRESFMDDKKNLVVLIIILLILIDNIAFMAANALDWKFKHRLTRSLRVLVYINFNEGKELRRAFRNVRKTLPDILNVFALFFVSILIFGFVGWQLFNDKIGLVYSNNQLYFQNFEDSIWDLYISVTTANFPDVMMPAFERNGAYVIFFVTFMLINFYIFINIILATIYTNYKRHLKEEVKSTMFLKRTKMRDAFDLIRVNLNELKDNSNQKIKIDRASVNGDDNEDDANNKACLLDKTDFIKSEYEQVVTREAFFKLLGIIDSSMNEKQIGVLFRVIDIDSNNLLTFREFVYLADLLNIRMSEIRDRLVLLEKLIPNIYNSRVSKMVRHVVKLAIFQHFFDLLILLNVIFVIIFARKNGYEWFFLSAFVIEIALKLYTVGYKRFVSVYWNIFDTIVIGSGFIAGIVEEASTSNEQRGSTELFEVILILRSLRLLKFVSSIKRFRTIISTIGIITPSLFAYAMLLLTIYYIFSMIGMEIFGNSIKSQRYNTTASPQQLYTCGNDRLAGTDFLRFRYCLNNFSSFPNSIILLFELMVVNQWHVLSRGFEDAMNSKWTRLYFLAFHITCVIILLNIFTAFVIEAFLLEYETEDKSTSSSSASPSSTSPLEQRIYDLGIVYNDPCALNDVNEDNNESNSSLTKRIVLALKGMVTLNEPSSVNTSINGTNLQRMGIRFHLNAKEAKPVEILLQRMFSDEFDIASESLHTEQPQRSNS